MASGCERDGNTDDNDVHIKWVDVDHGLWPGKGREHCWQAGGEGRGWGGGGGRGH